MFETLRTYLFIISTVLKIGGSSLKNANGDIQNFYRSNVIRVLGKEGEDWFSFLATPRTIDEIAERYGYTDRAFLQDVLDTLTEDKTITFNEEDSKYQTMGEVEENKVIPKVFNDSITGALRSFAKAIPRRLKGDYASFAGGIQLYNWDDILSHAMYELSRGCAFKFAKALNYKGKFIDIGCGNGYGTTVIWSYYEKKKCFYPGTKMEIFGLDPDEGFIDIAKNEFDVRLEKHLNYTKEQIKSLRPYFPQNNNFKMGSVTDIPFEDNTFDIVYTSQILHWTDPQVGLKEMIRVAKPGSLIFGGNVLFPFADKYMDLHIKTLKGAQGFFTKKEFLKYIKEAGGKDLKTGTPVTCFKFTK